MKKPTSEQLRAAREATAQARQALQALAGKLGTSEWAEATDGPAFDAAKRSVEQHEATEQRILDASEVESRAAQAPAYVPETGDKPENAARSFSLLRAIRAKYGIRNTSGQLEKMDGIEGEMAQEGHTEARNAEISDFDPNGFMLPQMIAYRAHNPNTRTEKRDLVVGTTTAGGFLVSTQNGEMIGFLDPETPLVRLGARVLTGLQGNLTFPRQSARATGYPVSEQGAITESQQTLQQLTLSPKRQGAYTEFSLQLIRQSDTSVENWLREDLRLVLSQLQERYAIQGTGTGSQPTGITATAGIGSVDGGTNGLIPAWAHIVGLETEVAIDNALRGKLGYLTTPQVAGVLKQVKRDVAGNGFIWEGMNDGNGMVNGYKAATSTLVPSTLTKGTSSGICHALLFGNWQELIMAYWGGVEIVLDPYTLATTGSYRITANAFMDVGVRNAQSFAAMLDALVA